jgi:hypothetical protein
LTKNNAAVKRSFGCGVKTDYHPSAVLLLLLLLLRLLQLVVISRRHLFGSVRPVGFIL